jgi:prolyl-tRNA synthetase
VPVRVEVGPRDLARNTVTIVRRDQDAKHSVPLEGAAEVAAQAVGAAGAELFSQASELLGERTVDVAGLDEAIEVARTGFARMPWADVGPDGERQLNEQGVSVRCLIAADGSLPRSLDDDDLLAVLARAY